MRRLLKTGFLSILLISSMLSMVSGQYLYLIENPITSEAWITTNQDVVFNSSLSGWILNSTNGEAPTYENFTTYSEQSGGSLTQTASRSTWTNFDRTAEGYCYNDSHPYATGSTYSAFFTLKMTAIESNSGGTILVYPFYITPHPYVGWGDQRDYRYANQDTYGLRVKADLSQSTKYDLTLIETDAGDQYSSGDISNLDVGTAYYVNFTKNGADIEVNVYSDADYSVFVGSQSLTMQTSKNALDCVNVPIAHGANAGARDSSGYVEDLTFDEPGGGYEANGLLITEDLLTNTTMSPAYVFCSKQTVPEGSTLTVSFSEDNSTFVRETELSTCDNCKTAIFLEDLNYSSLYVKYEFTSSGDTTPELEEIALAYQIDDPGGNANGWIYAGSIIPYIVGLATKKRL